MKICYRCKFEKDDDCFSSCQVKETWGKCKDCIKVINQAYYKQNKNEILESQKKYYEENKNEILEYRNKHYERKEYDKEYYQKHKDEKKEYKKEYCKKNKIKINKKSKEYTKNRRKNDPIYKLHDDISRAINKNLKENNLTKNNKSINELLPYTMKELKEYLENHPDVEDWMRDENGKLDWSKRGRYNLETWDPKDSSTWVWQIDHEIPKSKFKIKKEGDEEFQKCWTLTNLRPYSALKNILDGNRR